MPRQLIVALALAAWAMTAAAAELPPPDQELLHNARFWEAHDRGDLAQLALKKLVAARPDIPEPLTELGELDLRLNDFQGASQVETDLERRFPGSAAARSFATEVRVATRDRLPFASIRRLTELNRNAEVKAALGRLFPQGPPGGVLGLDYYLLLARAPGELASARAGLERLAAAHAGDPRYQLALAQLLVRDGDTALEGVRLLEELVRRDDVRRDDADRALASGLLRLGPDKAPAPSIAAYLVRRPEDSELVALREEQRRLNEERGLASAATAREALAALAQRLTADLSSGTVPAVVRAQVRLWLDRSRASLAADRELRAAAELRAALAFQRRRYESEIAIAKDLDAQDQAAEADELLAAAARLDPSSTWLFETWVRHLISHGDSSSAIALLTMRPLTGKWAASSRDALLASALEARAAQAARAGKLDAAVADLESAVRLAPRDAWLRYRLAGYYRDRGDAARGRELMSEGVAAAPDLPEMRYAQALNLSQIEEYAQALVALAGIPAGQRTDGMNALDDRMRVVLARAEARRLQAAGDLAGARAALLAVEPVASRDFDRARELGYSWIELGDSGHAIALVQPYVSSRGAPDAQRLIGWAQLLNSAQDDERLHAALIELDALPQLSAEQHADVAHLERELQMREIRALARQGNYAQAAQRLDALLARAPEDRRLRLARAELELAAGEPRKARDRLASLVAEDPDDLDARLSYVRALTESGDVALARTQLQALEAHMPAAADEELELSLARRQLALGDAGGALGTLAPLLSAPKPRADVLMLAGRAALAQGHLPQARDYFARAAAQSSGPEQLAARRASDEVGERLASGVAAGLIGWHQPGDPGMSQLDLYTLPSAWAYARDDGSRIIARADAVWIDAGTFSNVPGSLPLIGTVQAAGPGASLRYASGRQTGLSPAIGFENRSLSMDLGTTPLGFERTNVVGGAEWTPKWRSLNLTFGVARRAVTSSELSYAGMRDPVTGTSWGGVVASGPYAGFGVYRESYDVSGSMRLQELTGTHVQSNHLAGARLSTSFKLYSAADTRADAGVTLTWWSYAHNLQNYTFGSGGYYSPQSYLSVATPIELTGDRAGWVYRARASVSYTLSQVSSSAFYPQSAALEQQAASMPLPAGYTSPYFAGYRSTGFGLSAYAAAERQLSDSLVLGFMVDIDRTNYYHPTSIGLYLRHALGAWATRTVSPPRPIRSYNP